jgi:16S rRNA (cytosine967-C5)-methyltransferase
MLLAESHPKAKVIAAELHPHRVETLKKLCNAPNVEIMQADATRLTFPDDIKFDLVLADVPCSGTGTLGRNPEIKWRLKPEKLAELHELQFAIAENALAQAKPGGLLVYSTCSLEAEENEAVIERLLQGGGCEIVPVVEVLDRVPLKQQMRDNMSSILSGPYLRTIPGSQSCDGFFAAVLRKSRG